MLRFKYSTWIIIVAIFGLGWGASFAAGLTWSARILPGQEPAAAQAQAAGARGAGGAGRFAAAGAGGAAARGG
ncbi:MAG: hypothetical protein CL878_04755, partial [Dehalococcoidia bacterium]|nr:hypothetical protein [Dehalococcoidia bacterium]